jgi:uncharacterized protein YjbI with pentapeptide repeats
MGLGEHDGRIDLRGFSWSAATTASSSVFGKWQVDQLVGLPEFREIKLEGVDLSGSQLDHLRMFTSVIRDCRFDGASLRDARMWAVDVDDTSFEGTDLRDSALGATLNGRWNTFRRARFVDADLRGPAAPAATFDRCDFSGARMKRVEYESDFIDCRFAGRLDEVIFRSKSLIGGRSGTRRFERVDFADAEFHWVEFRGFDLDDTVFPTAPGHLVIEPFGCTLERAIASLKATKGLHRGLLAVLEQTLATKGPNQRRGVFDIRALRQAGDPTEEPVEQFLVDAMRECDGLSRDIARR